PQDPPPGGRARISRLRRRSLPVDTHLGTLLAGMANGTTRSIARSSADGPAGTRPGCGRQSMSSTKSRPGDGANGQWGPGVGGRRRGRCKTVTRLPKCLDLQLCGLLVLPGNPQEPLEVPLGLVLAPGQGRARGVLLGALGGCPVVRGARRAAGRGISRSEERRVGKECRSRWSTYEEKKKKNNKRERTRVQ